MKNKILTTAILATFAGAAHAQSSVTLYGLIDAGVNYINHVQNATKGSSSAYTFGDGVAQGSRWGLRGSEDLGGGLKAIFVLENGFNVGNGTAGQGNSLFGRQAYVGLTQSNIGSLTFGRQYSFSTDVLGSQYSTGGNTVSGNWAYHVNDVDQLTSSRISNAVKFQSVNYSGFTFGGLYGFSNTTSFAGAPVGATTASSRAYSFGANYAYGPFSLGGAYTDITYPAAASPTSFSTTLANVNTTGGAKGVIHDLRSFGFGGRYVVGAATMWLLWTNTRFAPITGSSTIYNAYEAGGKYAFTSAFTGALGYTYSRSSGLVTAHWNQVNASADYALSKRTDVYALVAYQDASGTYQGAPVQAQIGDSASSIFAPSGSGSQNQVAVRLGIRHKF